MKLLAVTKKLVHGSQFTAVDGESEGSERI
jgi:hypothetical protein